MQARAAPCRSRDEYAGARAYSSRAVSDSHGARAGPGGRDSTSAYISQAIARLTAAACKSTGSAMQPRAKRRVSQDAGDQRQYARAIRERVVGDSAPSRCGGGRRDSRRREKRLAELRQRALFWIARRAESQAAGIITQAIDSDPDAEVKRQAVSALSQLPRDEGIPLLIKLARSHTDPVVRKQAMQLLGQSRDPRAISFFEEVLR